MKKLFVLWVFIGAFIASPAYSAMYKCKMPDNSFQYSDKPCKKYTKKQETEVPDFTGKRINILFENKDIRKAFKEVAAHGNYSVVFHRAVSGTINANYYKTRWDEIIYKMAQSQDLSAMIVPGRAIEVTPNQMTLSGGNKKPKTAAEKLEKCQQLCEHKHRSCKLLVGNRAYGTTSYGCRSDHYQCQKACRPGISIY